MAKIKPADLGKAIQQELTVYHSRVVERLDVATEAAAKELVKRTKKTAPKGARRGKYRRAITYSLSKRSLNGSTYVWHVKAPEHRLTHLLVHGHATRNGKRTKSNSFLADAVDAVLPEYERAVEEAVKND